MAGKSTYADLVKKNVANSSPEPEQEQEIKEVEVLPKETKKSKSNKNKKIEEISTEEFPSVNGDQSLVNGYESKPDSPQPEKVAAPQPNVVEQPAEPEEEFDDTGFILIKARERKNSTASRQSGYRNSSSKPPRRNYKRSENGDAKKEVKKMTFDEKKDEEKAKFLKRFPKKDNFCFVVKQGDVFSAHPSVSLAHCVSEDFEAKDGVTKQFKERFGNLQNLLDQNVKTGGCAYLESEGRYLFYLVTRNFSYHRPYYSSVEKSLKELRKVCINLGVTELAMPLIGNRQDQLDSDLVSRIVDQIFNDTNINLTIYKYRSERRPPTGGSRQRKRIEE